MSTKYIKVKDLENSIGDNATGLIGSCITPVEPLYDLIKSAEPMIAVDDIEKIISNKNRKKQLPHSELLTQLWDLVDQQTKLYGGLSAEGVRKLGRLFSVNINNNSGDLTESFIEESISGGVGCDFRILPDDENHIRHHNGGNCPLPDNIEIEIYEFSKVISRLSQDTLWSGIFGYRIIGIKGQ